MKIVGSIRVEITYRNHMNARKHLELLQGVHEFAIEEVVERITALNEGLRVFWSGAEGWAPVKAAHLLAKSRLDRQVALSSTLKLWTTESSETMNDGKLILAWANLGSLVEGTMKLFLAVYYDTYKSDVNSIKKKLKVLDPDGLQLEPLRKFFRVSIWDDPFDKLVQQIQSRRNAIHAFQDRDIGTHAEFLDCVRQYLVMLRYINYRLPYPDEQYIPQEN